MPLSCDDCKQQNAQSLLVLPCQQPGGAHVYKPASTAAYAGTRQVPLLHLIYAACVEAYGPKGREVRTTWLAKKYSQKTGNELAQRKVTISDERAGVEVQEMVGMLLSQRPHLLPVLAQLDRARQLSVAQAIARLLLGTPSASALPTAIDVELFRGAAHTRLERANGELRRRLERMNERRHELEREALRLNDRQRLAVQRIGALDEQMLQLEGAMRARTTLEQDAASECQRLAQSLHVLFIDGEPATGQKLKDLIDLTCDDEQEERQVLQSMDAYNRALQLRSRYANERLGFARQHQEVARQREEIVRLLGTEEVFYERYERHLLEEELLQLDLRERSVFAQETRAEREQLQGTVQDPSLEVDFACQASNYAKLQEFEALRLALAASGVARQLFLLMHPRFKYIDDAEHRCKIHKFLASPEVLTAFRDLDEANLVHPGPHAKLGVMVMNAAVPGSYDDRHRELVQSELEKIAGAMDEFGMDREIRCHSCGHASPSGRSTEEAKPLWIRDHNPPTALYELGSAVYRDKLGLTSYDGNGVTGHQILLPQCRECSKRQGSLMARVTKLLKGVATTTLTHPQFDLVAWLRDAFVQADGTTSGWDDFVRVALRPMGGWMAPEDLRGELQSAPLGRLVTTGGAGSFDGIDDALMRRVGAHLGCHTCTDVARQVDPFRNISWIADHQPPTALVARGLMELPQLVYPHCWKCSDAQAQAIRRVTTHFNKCFGKDYPDTFRDIIEKGGHDDL
jgi:hypothetical protein